MDNLPFLPTLACAQAVTLWETTRNNFDLAKSLIESDKPFFIPKELRTWLKTNNNNTEFKIYLGVKQNVTDKELILIFNPLDENGSEKELTEYPYVSYTTLTDNITFTTTKIIEQKEEVVLNNLLKITTETKKKTEMPLERPYLSTQNAVNYVLQWKNSGVQWLKNHITPQLVNNLVVRVFTVPYASLSFETQATDVYCFIGLKYAEEVNYSIPVLIFVHTEVKMDSGKIVQTGTNTVDFTNPCPPVCGDSGMNHYFVFGS